MPALSETEGLRLTTGLPIRLCLALAIGVSGCARKSTPAAPPPNPDLALSGLAGQHVILLPTYTVRIAPELSWTAVRGRDVQRALDTAIAVVLDDRGVRRTWILPEQLAQSYRRNVTYAPDPYTLAEEPLRSPALEAGTRLPEPLASQIRTTIALHDEVRLVLAPVELRFERLASGMARPVLRLALLDGRLSQVRWFGDVRGDSVATYTAAALASVARGVANLVVTP
jgi:hypothetical protein